MHLRHGTVRKDGKTHTYWRLVRSVRVGSRVRQELVATLGELDAAGRARARALCADLAGSVPPGSLFSAEPPAEPIPVNLLSSPIVNSPLVAIENSLRPG